MPTTKTSAKDGRFRLVRVTVVLARARMLNLGANNRKVHPASITCQTRTDSKLTLLRSARESLMLHEDGCAGPHKLFVQSRRPEILSPFLSLDCYPVRVYG